MKPIPTKYKETLFRSRLEARWALFFDELGVKWLYEHEGYQLASGWYLPDFWLPSIDTFVEIKGVDPNDREVQLCSELSQSTGHRVILMSRELGWWVEDDEVQPYMNKGEAFSFFGEGGDHPYLPCVCRDCGAFGFQFEGRAARICRHDPLDDRDTGKVNQVIAAVTKANAHRFY